MPLSRQIAQHLIDFLPGTDIDTARRLHQQQQFRARFEPPAEQHLLLVATRKRGDPLGAIGPRAHFQGLVPTAKGPSRYRVK